MRKPNLFSKMLLAVSAAMLWMAMPVQAEPVLTEAAAPQSQSSRQVTGTVLDESGEPVIGASVMIVGSNTGTITDVDGRFSISAVPGTTLRISSIGFVTQEVVFQEGMNLRIVLAVDSHLLDEVVVTGYGTFKKSAYAGSAFTMRAETIADVPTTSVNEMLQGSAPGVTLMSTSGQPGSASQLRVRGMGSFNASNSPLYVIDGVPMVSGDISSLGSDNGLDVMATFNPDDIESITVIKDAAAASLYGSRAANGVIVITTKKGKEGKARVSLKADWGFSDFAMPYRETLPGAERRDVIYNGYLLYYTRDGQDAQTAAANALKQADKYAPEPWCGYTDWHDVFFRKGSHSNYEASLSGGTDKFKYFTSLNYFDQEGITATSGLKRITGRVNAEYKASDRFSLGFNGTMSNVDQDLYSEGTSYTAPFYASVSKVSPSDPVYNEDGSWNTSLISNGKRNPALSQAYDKDNEKVNRFMETVWGEYEFIDNLKFKSTLSYDYMTTKGREWEDPRTSNGSSSNGDLYISMYERKNLNWMNQLTYNTVIADNHNIDALLGFETSDYSRDYISAESSNFAYYQTPEIATGATTESVGGSSTGYRLVSYLGRANYDYMNKYFLGASARVDGSSRLSPSSRWGTFWSVSGAWRFMEEDFMSGAKDVLTDGKLRASYGVNGTLPSDYFGYMGLYSVSGSYQENSAYLPSQVSNENLSWEKNNNLNLGLDLTFYDRIRLTAEYYTRTTNDLLMDMPISMTSGYDSYLTNIGQVFNHGMELELSADIIRNRNFTWNSTFTFSTNKNEIKVLDGIQDEIISSPYIHKVGSSYYTYYLYEFAGINPDNGNAMFYKNTENPDGSLDRSTTEDYTECERTPYKHAEPVSNGAFVNSFRYRFIDLSFNFNYQFGGYSYDNWAQKTEACDASLNIPTYYRRAWKQPGDITDIEVWMPSKSSTYNVAKIANTRRVHSSDFIRLRNVTLGLTVPGKFTSRIGVEKVRVYFSGSNLWTWAAHDFYDPETGVDGYATWSTPPLKTATFGIDLTF